MGRYRLRTVFPPALYSAMPETLVGWNICTCTDAVHQHVGLNWPFSSSATVTMYHARKTWLAWQCAIASLAPSCSSAATQLLWTESLRLKTSSVALVSMHICSALLVVQQLKCGTTGGNTCSASNQEGSKAHRYKVKHVHISRIACDGDNECVCADLSCQGKQHPKICAHTAPKPLVRVYIRAQTAVGHEDR